MSSVETGQMSAVETGQMTAAETSVLSQQKTVKKHIVFVCLSSRPGVSFERAKVSVTKYRFLQQLLALELRARTPGTLHRSLEKPSEPLSASTVWGIKPAGPGSIIEFLLHA